MTATTIVKTIGSTGTFSTIQLWEDGAPVNLTTTERSAATTFLVAAFTQGENLTFVGSGATGKFLDTDSTGVGTGSYVTYGVTTGNPAASDVVTGATSGATCILTSGTPDFTGAVWQGQCLNETFTLSAVIQVNGTTVSSTAYKELTTVAGASFMDNANAQTNALRYDSSNGAAITRNSANNSCFSISEGFYRISKLQIEGSATNSRTLTFSAADGYYIDNMILEGRSTDVSSGVGGVVAMSAGSNVNQTYIRNSIIIQRGSAADHIVGVGINMTINIVNCTIVAPDDLATAPTSVYLGGGGGGSATTVNSTNVAIYAGDSTKAIKAGGSTFNFTTCYSDISGTTGVTQCTYGNQFVDVNDATRDFRLKAGADMLDTGTTDSTNAAFDIVGTSRPQGSAYDVGCWELVVPKGTYLDPLVFGGAL